MKLYRYDIWDSDKGVIIANNLKEAKSLFKADYPDVKFGYEDGECQIEELGEMSMEPELWVTEA